jgi:hypothetical protein
VCFALLRGSAKHLMAAWLIRLPAFAMIFNGLA